MAWRYLIEKLTLQDDARAALCEGQDMDIILMSKTMESMYSMLGHGEHVGACEGMEIGEHVRACVEGRRA